MSAGSYWLSHTLAVTPYIWWLPASPYGFFGSVWSYFPSPLFDFTFFSKSRVLVSRICSGSKSSVCMGRIFRLPYCSFASFLASALPYVLGSVLNLRWLDFLSEFLIFSYRFSIFKLTFFISSRTYCCSSVWWLGIRYLRAPDEAEFWAAEAASIAFLLVVEPVAGSFLGAAEVFCDNAFIL